MEWYYVGHDDSSNGPVSVAVMKSLYASKEIDDETAVWNESMTDWVQISTLPDLKKQLCPPPPKPAAAKAPPPRATPAPPPAPVAPAPRAPAPRAPAPAPAAPAPAPAKKGGAPGPAPAGPKGGYGAAPAAGKSVVKATGVRLKTRTEAMKGKQIRNCLVSGCNNPAVMRGYCNMHANEAASGAMAAAIQVGLPDMVLLTNLSHNGIAKNLKERHAADQIYTYIGHVLVAVNPYKWIKMYESSDIQRYMGKSRVDGPPHIFATAEACYRNMLTEEDNQCVIISGESGAGKTEASKHVQNYIAAVSGGGPAVDEIKRKFLESNPLLESFGNAKTIRNNNSSRFGKYFELMFDAAGRPQGGKVTNYLLEKSRVVRPGPNERGYHIFYQLIAGSSAYEREQFGLRGDPREFNYLDVSGCYTVDKVDDKGEFKDTKDAMSCMGIGEDVQFEVLSIVAAILHLGNIDFNPSNVKGADGSVVMPDRQSSVAFAAYLLGIDAEVMTNIITYRKITVRNETTYAAQNPSQACSARDALSKALYARLFDRLVEKVNVALDVNNLSSGAGGQELFTIAVLDIFGFEIFNKNGFEQFCINYVNEKLQQIFIRLTLKGEQEEYEREGITWTPIDFFNNEVVCTLIDSINPPGCLSILDDTCKSIHGQAAGIDDKFLQKMNGTCSSHHHYRTFPNGFQIEHYAGPVNYAADGFCEANKDLLFDDMRLVLKGSTSALVQQLFPEDIDSDGPKKAPTTAGFKIRKQCEALVDALMECEPHYIRCLKSNDEKKPNMFDVPRVEHQVTYLGLLENVRVRRAGFAYRAEYNRFLKRYRSLCPETFPVWLGDDKDGSRKIIQHISRTIIPELGGANEVQYGASKIFIRQPETFFALEQAREKQQTEYAGKIQGVWKKFSGRKHFIKLKQSVAPLFNAKKERREGSIFREYEGEYVKNQSIRQQMRDLISTFGENERVVFTGKVSKLAGAGSGMKASPLLLAITEDAAYLMQEVTVKGTKTAASKVFLKLRVPISTIEGVVMTPYADDFMVIQLSPHRPKPEPVKTHIIDKSTVKACMRCSKPFGMLNWTKTCHNCGGMFCSDCTSEKSTLPTLGHYAPVRICATCHGRVVTSVEEDILIQSAKKTEIFAVLADIYEGITGGGELRINFQSSLTLRAAPVLSETVKKPVEVSRDNLTKGTAMNPSNTMVRVGPGADLNKAQARLDQIAYEREQREIAAQQEREMRRQLDEASAAQREEMRRQRLAEKKARKEADRAARKGGRPAGGSTKPTFGGPAVAKTSAAPKPAFANTVSAATKAAPAPPGGSRPAPTPTPAARPGGSAAPKFKVPAPAAGGGGGPPCRECGCTNFTPHMFKKGFCAGCGHDH